MSSAEAILGRIKDFIEVHYEHCLVYDCAPSSHLCQEILNLIREAPPLPPEPQWVEDQSCPGLKFRAWSAREISFSGDNLFEAFIDRGKFGWKITYRSCGGVELQENRDIAIESVRKRYLKECGVKS